MKIEEVKKLDDGVSGISIEGKLTKAYKPKEGQYGWSQFVVIEDDTANIGSNINIENEESLYSIGQYIKIKGKVSKYVKGGKSGISLNGNVIDEIVKADEEVSQVKPNDQLKVQPNSQSQEYTKDDYWRDKTAREVENNKCIVRECAIKASTEIVTGASPIIIESKEEYFKLADEIVDYINKNQTKIEMIKPRMQITSEAITKEFGGTVEEKPQTFEVIAKEQRIADAKKIVNMVSQAQKDMVEKIVKSRYITEKEVKNIGDLNLLTKENASKYISYWFGDKEKMGERDKRELTEKEENPLIVDESKPVTKNDPNDESSLIKDLLIETINKQRKELHLEDDEKFKKEIGYNPKLEELTEEKLLKLKELLKDWKPAWITEKCQS